MTEVTGNSGELTPAVGSESSAGLGARLKHGAAVFVGSMVEAASVSYVAFALGKAAGFGEYKTYGLTVASIVIFIRLMPKKNHYDVTPTIHVSIPPSMDKREVARMLSELKPDADIRARL